MPWQLSVMNYSGDLYRLCDGLIFFILANQIEHSSPIFKGQQPDASAGRAVARSAKGEKPGGYAVGAIDVSASVVGIDKKKRTLTLELPEGNVGTTEVDESVKAFDTMKVGDSIHARLTKAIAISVETP